MKVGNSMKKCFKIFTCSLVSISLLFSTNFANAKRIGGGKSSGRQNTTAIQRANDPHNAPPMQNRNQQQNSQANQQQVAPAAQQQPQKSRFGGMGALLGGVAAGLGMAWLASKLGLGAGFGNILMIVALVLLGIMLFRMFKSKQQSQSNINNDHNPSYAGLSPNQNANQMYHSQSGTNAVNTDTSLNQGSNFSSAYKAPETYNDPHTTTANNSFAGNPNYANNNAGSANIHNNYPAEVNELVNNAYSWFMNLQELSDKRNLPELQKLLSPELFVSIKADLENSPMSSKTMTQNLQHALLDWRETQFEFLSTIQYKAEVSEDGSPFTPINEAWTFTKDKTAGLNAPWKLDGISQLNMV